MRDGCSNARLAVLAPVRQTIVGRSSLECPENLDIVWQGGHCGFRTGKRTSIPLAHVCYARVSTIDQDPALQLDALSNAGCTKVFEDRASGARVDRAGLRSALEYVRDGDVLIVWKLDRLGRSLPHLIETVMTLEKRGVGFRSLTEAIDTTTPVGVWFSICLAHSGSSSATSFGSEPAPGWPLRPYGSQRWAQTRSQL